MAEATYTSPPFKVLTVFPRVWKLMTKREKQKSGVLFFGTILNSFVEVLGLATIIPVIGLVIEPELIRSNPYINQSFELSDLIGVSTEREFLMLTSVLMVAAFFFKAIFNLGLNLFQTRFSLGIGHRISGLMWQYHFSQSLERMRSQESGRVLAEISGWPNSLANQFIVGSLRLINELVVILLIAIGLLSYQPVVFFSVSALLIFGVLIIRAFTKNRLDLYSDVSKKIGPAQNTRINNAIRGFLEVITFRASSSILKHYLSKQLVLIRISSNSQIMNMAPSKLYEVLAVTAVSSAIFISLALNKPNEDFLNLLIIMALSAYRVMPSMTRINGLFMAMRKSKYVLEVIEENLHHFTESEKMPPKEHRSLSKLDIQISQLTIGYESLPQPVLSNLSISFPSGAINAIVGPSGSGKSTLVNTILGLHRPEKGTIRAGSRSGSIVTIGEDIEASNWLEHIGYLSQNPYLFNGTVRENLTMMIPGETLDEDAVMGLIERLELDSCFGDQQLDFELLEGGNNLSGGQQQRLAILRALRVHRPLLILDEATSALDSFKRDIVFELLRERARSGTNVLLITHDLELASQCDNILDLENLQA